MNEIIEGLEQAADYLDGRDIGQVVEVVAEPLDVRRIRERLNLSQPRFAEAFRLSLKTVQNWEQGNREPEGPARTLLTVIKHHPEAVLDALARERRAYRVVPTDEPAPRAVSSAG